MGMSLPPALRERVLTVEEAEALKRLIEEMPARDVKYVSVPLLQIRCQDCEANKALSRVRALLQAWEIGVRTAEQKNGAESELGRDLLGQLRAAVEGEGCEVEMEWYLDCYFYGAVLGDKHPVNSYGPASKSDIEQLQSRIEKSFNRTEITRQTRGQNPLPRHLWADVKRPK
jgi:hypothetical protein